MSDSMAQFQSLLRELFQFDLADLDFGIYRIMNHKRHVIERWITEGLPKAIEEELRQGALAEQSQAQQALEESRRKVLETLGEKAIDVEGNLATQFANTPLGKAYLEAREKAAHAQPSEALEAQVYNHLYTFFSRYYQDGDFISKRRYSKKERYAIPYNGEEVYLYWANHDQYYVKTAEHFRYYSWKAPNGVTVHFKLHTADVEVDNVKDEKRFFLPVLDGIAWDAETRTLIIPFEYRPLSEEELLKFCTKAKNGKYRNCSQEKINKEALQTIPAKLKGNAEALAALSAERRSDAKGKPVSFLAHHLRQYTARNTRDFFIHKDLRGFLSRELDFYLKNEVLNLDELEAAGEDMAAGWFQLMRLIKSIGNHIIDFLAQIEDFQKALWEKRKFITEAFYVVTVGNIPEDLYPNIAANDAQWKEWNELGMLTEDGGDSIEDRPSFIAQHPSLPVDTRHFPQDFTDRLLASFDNLDEKTDGLLVHSENWQALNLLVEKYRERVRTIYIDPPYNTGNDEFLYRDNYQHSSWLSLMYDRIENAFQLLNRNGTFWCSIDDNEEPKLHFIYETIFGAKNILPTVVERRRKSQPNLRKGIAPVHDYLKVACRDYGTMPRLAYVPEEFGIGTFSNPDNDPRGPWTTAPCSNRGGTRYKIVTPAGVKYEDEWRFTEETYERLLKEGRIYFPDSGRGKPRYKIYLSEKQAQGVTPSTWWDDVGDTQSSNILLGDLFGSRIFDNPKSVDMLQRIIEVSTSPSENGYILDYFAGSGTTGHAVINLNREDGGRRKFILVEMGEYFDTVLLPRIKKVTFTPEWKDGRPKRIATQEESERGPRIVKVIRLESYEDALNNITFDRKRGQKALQMFNDEYLLRYTLKWESKKSETFLDVENLQNPFSYELRIHRDGEPREQSVDLPETFAYLIGLDIERRQVLHDGNRRYLVHRGTTRDGRKVAVIWREIQGWEDGDYERDAQFVAGHGLTEGADDVFVNGDSYIEGARSLNGLFKARLFGRDG